jgi:RNA polymerase sigma-70 factor (ECF subfamily)
MLVSPCPSLTVVKGNLSQNRNPALMHFGHGLILFCQKAAYRSRCLPQHRRNRLKTMLPMNMRLFWTEFGILPAHPLHLFFSEHETSLRPAPTDFSQPTPMSTIQLIAGENEQHPDVALVDRVRGGDVSAYDTLVRKYERQIFRIAQHITQNREDAEDVMQDAFLKAYEKLDQFQGNSKFYTWLVRIAVNESLMRLRKRRTGRMVSIDEDVETEEGSVPRDLADWAPDPEQNYTQTELHKILEKTIKGLPPGFKVVFELRDVQGLSTEDTADALGLSIPAVKSRLLRARLQLRERLSRYFRKKKVPREKRDEK